MNRIKKFFGLALLLTVALLVAGYALHGKKADTLSDLAKENIRALADDTPGSIVEDEKVGILKNAEGTNYYCCCPGGTRTCSCKDCPSSACGNNN